MIKDNLKHYFQFDSMDCDPICLQMTPKFHGRNYSVSILRDRCNNTCEGVSLIGISDAAESIGFRSIGVKVGFEKLIKDALLFKNKVQKFVVAHYHNKQLKCITNGEK